MIHALSHKHDCVNREIDGGPGLSLLGLLPPRSVCKSGKESWMRINKFLAIVQFPDDYVAEIHSADAFRK
jgi:hypothetical protein